MIRLAVAAVLSLLGGCTLALDFDQFGDASDATPDARQDATMDATMDATPGDATADTRPTDAAFDSGADSGAADTSIDAHPADARPECRGLCDFMPGDCAAEAMLDGESVLTMGHPEPLTNVRLCLVSCSSEVAVCVDAQSIQPGPPIATWSSGDPFTTTAGCYRAELYSEDEATPRSACVIVAP